MEKENKPNVPANNPGSPVNRPNAPVNKPGIPAGKPNPVKPIQAKDTKKSKGVGAIIFLSIFALILAVGSGLLLREFLAAQHEAENNLIAKNLVEAQRDELLAQLDDLEEAFQQLTLEYSELETNLRGARGRIARLRAELAEKSDDPALKERIEELELLLEQYQQEAEMLKSENQALSSEKSQIQSSLSQATAYTSQLEREKREIEDQLENASILSVSNIEANGVRTRRRGDEPTDNARRTSKIQVCFTINQNLVALPGNREFFVRIIDPNNRVLTSFPDNTFTFEGDELSYTVNRTVNFQNNAQDVCVVYEQDERFAKGYYNIVVFSEGYEMGFKLMELR